MMWHKLCHFFGDGGAVQIKLVLQAFDAISSTVSDAFAVPELWPEDD
jgi:hypothetical protein